ncbi:MAG TPA: hypothetical protein VHX66_08070 [Solirubrobacteraceae bacterium]|jgi:hypothetical protein|nr:hypothetical protein [Solirubrobacteraceae bacterium]
MAITQAERILDLALAGHSVAAIAQAMAVGEATVTNALQDLTITPSGQGGNAGGAVGPTGPVGATGPAGPTSATGP